MLNHRGSYPGNWKEIADEKKYSTGDKCERCGQKNEYPGKVLTVHHVDGDKSNCEWFNLVALCQSCHLKAQARYNPDIFIHSSMVPKWMYPYYVGRRLALDKGFFPEKETLFHVIDFILGECDEA